MKNISYEQAIQLKNYFGAILVDVQPFFDYEKMHIPGSINIPLEEIGKNARNMLKNRDAYIILYCQKGVRSIAAVDILEKLGYQNVFNMQGGFENGGF